MAAKSYTFVKDKQKNKFLNIFVSLGTVSRAAEKMKLSRQTHYDWLWSDDDYAAAFERAKEIAGDMLEDEAFRRATGYEENVYHKGKKVGTKVVYSDRLLEFLLKGAKPDKYKDRVQQETVDMGAAAINWEGIENVGDETEDNNSVPAGEAVAE